jgi:hypothetical protein
VKQKLANIANIEPHKFKPGQSGNPSGKPLGIRNTLTEQRRAHYRDTGMMPLDFEMACMRDELYDTYEIVSGGPHRALGFRPTEGAKKIPVKLEYRMQAARDAAPYFHRKQPIAIQAAGDTPLFSFDLGQLGTKDVQLALGLVRELKALLNPEGNHDGSLEDAIEGEVGESGEEPQ